MGAMASQITSFVIVYSKVYLDADQRKHQSSVSLAFVRGLHRWPVNSPHKWTVTRKMFPFDDVIMIHTPVRHCPLPRYASVLRQSSQTTETIATTPRWVPWKNWHWRKLDQTPWQLWKRSVIHPRYVIWIPGRFKPPAIQLFLTDYLVWQHWRHQCSVLLAFRTNYGCHHVLTKFIHDCKVAIDKGLNVGVVLMDLSKAFDCVPHGLLLTKLKYYGLTDQACLLLKSYISDRKQRVKIGIPRSAWGPVDHGVPQGSILGPLIFNIFINDLFYAMDDVCNVYNYADDNTLLNTDHRIDSLVAKLENSAMVATHWFDINGMKSNQSKFQAMILNKHPDQNNISLNVNGTNVPLKSCVKLLGVFIDYELTFSEHVNYICKRTLRQLNAIRRISKHLKRDCLMKLFHAFVSSNFNYCPTAWHFTSKSSTMKIEKVHKGALRVVYNDYTTSYSGLLDMSNRTPLFLARCKGLLVKVFKCIRGLNPDFMNTIFVMDNKPYDTRSGSNISQNRVKTIKYGIQSFAYQGAKCWNRLPANSKEIEHLNEFRRHVSQWNGSVCHCGCCVACTIEEL